MFWKLANPEYGFILSLLAFLLGFLIQRLVARRQISQILEEREEVSQRLQDAERLISKQLSGPLNMTDILTGTDDHGGEDILRTGEGSDSVKYDRFIPENLIRLTKIAGGDNAPLKTGDTVVGETECLPVVGKGYRLIMQSGELITLPEVTRLDGGFIEVPDATYKVEYLAAEDEDCLSWRKAENIPWHSNEKTIHDIVLESAKRYVATKGEKFSAADLYRIAKEAYPDLKQRSFSAYVVAAAPDHNSWKHRSSKRDYLNYLGNGRYKLKSPAQ